MKKFSFILALLVIISTLGCVQTGIAFAASETVYSSVLEDLGKDETFDVERFPESAEDKIDVFQIAESNDGELFLYVYAPMGDKLTASEVRLSTSIGDNLDVKDYTVTLLSRSGTLAKYKVNDFVVQSDSERKYYIVQIARPWNEELDNGNVVNTVAYVVEKLFTASTVDENTIYTQEYSDSIEIESKYVGNLRYYDGGTIGQDYTTSHYVAFSTDVNIDKIYEVDVSYVEKKYEMVSELDFKSEYYKELPNLYLKETSSCQVTLHSDEYTGNVSKWEILSHTWKTIQTADKFVKSENLNVETKEQLKDKQWVLRFAKTDFHITNNGLLIDALYAFSDVSEVTVLRLNFLSNGKVYNLGVVDNKQTGSSVNKPGNAINDYDDFIDKLMEFFNWLAENWWVIIIGVVIIALVVTLCVDGGRKVLAAVFKWLGKASWLVVKHLYIGLGYVLASPILLIICIVRKAKEHKHG